MAVHPCVLEQNSCFLQNTKNSIQYTRTVLRLLKDADVTHKLENCAFFPNQIDYLGHAIKLEKLEVANHKTGSIR